MLGVHNSNAADGRKPLVLSSRLLAAADLSRSDIEYIDEYIDECPDLNQLRRWSHTTSAVPTNTLTAFVGA